MPKINAYAFDADVMTEFFDGLDQIHLVAIHPSRPAPHNVKGRYCGTDTTDAVEWAQALNRDGFGIYWTVNRVPIGFSSKPGKANMVAARFVHCDIDPPRDGEAFALAATLETLDNLRCPPSLVIGSGNGLQPLWRLDDDCENLEAIEAINQQVRTMFGADACWNMDRLFRVPGSINWPSPTKLARGRKPAMATLLRSDTGECYAPETLRAFFPEAEHGPSVATPRANVSLGSVSLVTPDQLRMTPFSRARKAVEKPEGKDRSVDAYHAACELVRDGYGDDVIAGILLNPENAVSGHVLDQADPMRAARRVIERARGEEPEAQEVPSETREAVAAIAVKPEQPKVAIVSEASDWYAMLTPGLKLMVDTIMEYAPSPRAELALGSALACFSTAAGRRYASPTGILTNMYVVALMASGAGKEFPLRAVEQVLTYARAERMVGGRIVSATGIRSALEAQPALFVPAAEFGKLVEAMNNPRGTLKDAVAMLLELYSEAQSFTKGGMYANAKERQSVLIHHPCLTLYGVSTPAAFWVGLTSQAVADGFLPRMLLLIDQSAEPMPRFDLGRCVWPDALTDHVAAIVRGVPDHVTFPMGEQASCKPYGVPYADDAARERWQAIRLEEWQYRRDNPDAIHAFMNRLAENATKLALVRAIDRSPETPELRADDFEFGYMLAKRSIDTFMREIDGNLAENELHANSNKVLDCIKRAGADGLRAGEITKRCPGIPKRLREEILEDLVERGSVETEQIDGKGRRTWLFRLRKDVG